MWTLLRMAFRNVFRFKRRSFITFTAVSLGLAMLIMSITLMNGIDRQSISNIINCQTSHLKIFKKGYFDKRDELPMDLTIREMAEIHKAIGDVPDVTASENRILFGAGLIKGMDELPCLGVAVEPERDPDLFNIKESLVKGEWLEPGDVKMLVGETLARDIGISVGDLVTVRLITSTDKNDFSWNAVDMEVKGIFDSGNPNVDSGRIIIPLRAAQEALSMDNGDSNNDGGEVTEIVVRLNSHDDSVVTGAKERIREKLKGFRDDLEVREWKELAGAFLAISAVKTKRSAVIILVILAIASMGIVNTMLMAVMERTREIGMMAAMGMKKSEIMRLFILEGGIIGLIGSLLGCVIGGLISWYLEVEGWSLAGFGESMQKITQSVYPIKGAFYADLTFDVLLMVFIFGTLIAVVASIYPARKAVKMKPVEALRHI